MPPALPVVRVEAATRNAGKTWLAAALIRELASRGYEVGAVKHSHHLVPPDSPDSDTDRFARAGAARVAFSAADGLLVRAPHVPALDAALEALLGQVDIAIVEGFRSEQTGARLHIDASTGRAHLVTMDGREVLEASRDDAPAFADAIERTFELASGGDERLRGLVRRAAAHHGHLCPGIVLGVRMAIAATTRLGVPLSASRNLDVTVETARCAVDAIAAATGCSPGRRNLHVEERGRLAARFVDLTTGRAVRLRARDGAKAAAAEWAPGASSARHAQAIAYRVMPDEQLFEVDAAGAEPGDLTAGV